MSAQEPIEVVNDDEGFEEVDDEFANSNERIAQDEKETMDQSNIMRDRTRHARPQTSNRYNEGPSEDDLPEEVQ